jgi:hypoxanthine phosphoribosyltransferase
LKVDELSKPFERPGIEVLFDERAIVTRVAQLGAQITQDYAQKTPLTLVPVLKGSYVFAADLARHIDLPVHVEFIGVRSYGSSQVSSGEVQITLDTKHPLEGQHVLIVEDIVDTGLTLAYLRENFATRRPASLGIAALLRKPSRTLIDVEVEYVGFTVPDRFVVGYGLDDAGLHRNLPYIGAYRA